MDFHAGNLEQSGFMARESLKLYFFAFVFIIFMQEVYFTPVFTFAFLCSLWVPQIWKNTAEGIRNCPQSIKFVIASSIHLSFIPLYFMCSDNNILFLEPHRISFWVCFVWIALQIVTLIV